MSTEYTVLCCFTQIAPNGLHITLGVFMRLFTLMEDECHKLDLEMAESTSMAPSTSDKPTFINFTALIAKERELLDKKKNLEDQVKWLDQTLSLLALTSSSTTPPMRAVQNAMEERRNAISAVVRK